MKRVEDLWGSDVVAGNLIKNFHELAGLFEAMLERIKQDYRASAVKHADETGWRTEGSNGYSWLFSSADTSFFRFEQTRASSVVVDMLGEKRLPGVLVVDRYAAYNKAPCALQYCYAHLLRKVKDAQKEFSDEAEVKRFVETVAPLLSKAMWLRGEKISDKQYYKRAMQLKEDIMAAMNSPGQHPAVQEIQDIFREKKQRLFHWVENRKVPADNNRAERELRPTVIARKVSFGSQSKRGAKTRSVLMSVLHTVSKRLSKGQRVEDWLNGVLQAYIHEPNVDFVSLLPRKPP